MSRSLNKVQLIGNLGADAEGKFTTSGVHVANFSLATERSFKVGDDLKTETDWHRVTIWRSEKLCPYLKKGTKVYVEGRLQTRSYENKGGEKRYVTEVVAENLILLGGASEGAERAGKGNPRGDQGGSKWDGSASDGDVPF